MTDLRDLPLTFIDVQTTGAGPKSGRILEIAWAEAAGEVESVVLRGEVPVARRILQLTGLTEDAVAAGVDEATALARLETVVAGGQGNVAAHYARFEEAFVEDLWRRQRGSAAPLLWHCTHAIGKRLYPDLPSGSLRALAGYLGFVLGPEKRAAPHVEATRWVWHRLVEELGARASVRTSEDLATWLKGPTPKASGARLYLMDRQKRLAFPDEPGVYRMVGASGRVLYVGKATSLKARVNSYFRQQRGHSSAKRELLAQVTDILVTPCETALEAALLEVDEIKRHDPPYNVALRAYDREVVFLTRHLTRAAPGTQGCYGPYGSYEPFRWLAVVVGALASGDVEGLTDLFHREVGPEVLGEGLALFHADLDVIHDREAWTMRSAVALGLKLIRAQETLDIVLDDDEADDDADEADGEERKRQDLPVTAEDVAARIKGTLLSAARYHRRARQLRRLATGVVAWRSAKSPRWRQLTISRGAIHSAREFVGSFDAPADFLTDDAGPAGTCWDIPTYDRICVLLAELGREARGGGQTLVNWPTWEDLSITAARRLNW